MLSTQAGASAFNNSCSLGTVSPIIEWIKQYPQEAQRAFEQIKKCTETEALALASQLIRLSSTKIETLLSIGPGNGMIEAVIAEEIRPAKIILIDIEQTEGLYHGFNSKGSGYAELKKTAEYIYGQGFTGEVRTCNPSKSTLPCLPIDACISLLSMGFHYPAAEYAAYIRDNANPGALIIYDHRKGYDDTSLRQVLQFSDQIKADDGPKSARLYLKVKQKSELELPPGE